MIWKLTTPFQREGKYIKVEDSTPLSDLVDSKVDPTCEYVGRSVGYQTGFCCLCWVSIAGSMPYGYRLAKKEHPTNIWLTLPSLGTKFTLVISILIGLTMKRALLKQQSRKESTSLAACVWGVNSRCWRLNVIWGWSFWFGGVGVRGLWAPRCN